MSALSHCPHCGAHLGAHYPHTPLRVFFGDDFGKVERAAQCVRVLSFFGAAYPNWRTEADAAIALGSTAVHSRMSNIRERHGDLWESQDGPRVNGQAGRKLYRFRSEVRLQDEEA